MTVEAGSAGAPFDVASARSVHLVGIGGAAMTPLGTILLQMGLRVSGSDVTPSAATEALKAMGATVFLGHRPEQVGDPDVVVASSAVPPDNPELDAARARGIPVVKHSAALACLMRRRRGVAIAGTHGKTTTSALAAWMLDVAGLAPTFHVGSELLNYGLFGRLGQGDFLVAEADEFDRRFLDYDPEIAVVTSVEADHLDYFGSVGQLVGAFEEFARRVRPGGFLIVSADDRVCRSLPADHVARVTYGFADDANWRVVHWQPAGQARSQFSVRAPNGSRQDMEIGLLGRHNAANATAVVALGAHLDVPMRTIAEALARFRGTRRRFEVVGTAAEVTVVDDYAHHPTEIRATLAAARAHFGWAGPTAGWETGAAQHQPASIEAAGEPLEGGGSQPSIWAVFQPHTAHRTSSLFDGFAHAFGDADHVIVTPTYRPPGRELDEDDPTVAALVAAMPHRDSRALSPPEAVNTIASRARAGDLVVVMGAGDVWTIESAILSEIRRRRGMRREA